MPKSLGDNRNADNFKTLKANYRVTQKSKPLPNYQKNRIKSCQNLWVGSDLFVKLKYESSTII